MKELKDVIKKGSLMALGVAVVTKEQAEKVAKKLLAKGQANEKNVKALGNKILREAKSKQKEMEKEAKKAMERMQKKAACVMGEKKPVKKKTAKKKK